jgi:hypothetical protein
MIRFRGHTLVIGATGTGKGVLTSTQAEAWRAAGMKVFLLCNKEAEYAEFPADFKTMKQDRLLKAVQALRAPDRGYVDTMVVIDEAWDWKWKGSGGLQMIPNAARAHGVEMWVQSQFPTQMAPTVRNNCDNIFCFALRPNAAEWAAKEYHPVFAKAPQLKPGQYIGLRGLGTPFTGLAWYHDEQEKFRRAG